MSWLRRLLGLRSKSAPIPERPAPPSGPTAIGVVMVKNEQDMIEPFVRHNLRFLDALLVVDNGSLDGTRRILADLVRELPGLMVADWPNFSHAQGACLTRLMEWGQEAFFADYIVPLDADEFLRAPDRAAFHAALARLPPGGVGLIPWQTFVPTPPDLAEGAPQDPPRTLRRRRAAELPLYAKAIMRLDGASARGLSIDRGNHNFLRDGVPIPHALVFQDLALIHAPVRSLPQVQAKAVVGWLSLLAFNPGARQTTDSYQKRVLFDAIADGAPMGAEDVTRLALDYAQDPAEGDWQTRTVADDPGWTYQRRLSDGTSLDVLPMIARTWQQSQVPVQPPFVAEAPGATLDVPPLRFLIDRFRPDSVLDIGGGAAKLFAQYGVATATGADTPPRDLGRAFDLVLCLGPADALDSVLRHAGKTIVFAATAHDVPYWLGKFRARGWLPDWPDTASLRAAASLAHLRRNALVLRRAADVAQDGTARLEAIAARSFVWYDQTPGLRATVLDEPEPPTGSGYV